MTPLTLSNNKNQVLLSNAQLAAIEAYVNLLTLKNYSANTIV